MPTRRQYIEQVRRQIYNGQPSDDATITVGLVNQWLDQALCVAAKANYKDSIQLEGIAFVNGGFYTTYKGIAVQNYEQFLYKVALPHLPVGLGNDEGISTLKLYGNPSEISQPIVWLTQYQRAYAQDMRPIPNKLLGYLEGGNVYLISTLLLSTYTATVTMISGGVSTDLDSTLNVPGDYFPIMTSYLIQQLMMEHTNPIDVTNDGLDAIKTT